MIYLDWAATALPRNNIIRKSLEDSMPFFGNPSSLHTAGSNSKKILDKTRDRCSKLLGCNSNELYFTSGATESNNIAILSFLKKHSAGEIITTSIEHPSILEPVTTLEKFGWKVKRLNPSNVGLIPLKKIEKSINENSRIISLIYVHNETGVVQPLLDIIDIIRRREMEYGKKIHIHIDGVQALGKITINLKALDIDSISFSGHKFGAPKGTGLLYLKRARDVLYRGGGQERGIRPGTESIFSALAITSCLKACLEEQETTAVKLNKLMDRLISGVREIGVSTIPKSRTLSDSTFVPNIVSLTIPPLPGEVVARVLDSKGFMISTGSACSSNKKSTTRGILSMGITESEGFSSVRVSIGPETTNENIEKFLKALEETINELAP